MAGYILPLCTVDEVRAELADTNQAIDRCGELSRIVDRDQLTARRRRLTHWRDRLQDQLDAMQAA